MDHKLNIPKRHLVFKADGSVSGKRITLKANSGRPFPHDFWKRLALDLSGMKILKSRLPILLSHDTTRPIGFFDRDGVRVNGGLHVEGQLVDSSHAREFTKIANEGVPFEASLRGNPKGIQEVKDGEATEVNGHEFRGPGHIWRDWQLLEASPCIFGRDSDTKTDVFTFAGANELVMLDIEDYDEDERLADEIFSMGLQARTAGVRRVMHPVAKAPPGGTGMTDDEIAESIFRAGGGNWWERT